MLLVPLSVVVGVVVFWVSVGVVAVVTPRVPVDPVQAVHHAESCKAGHWKIVSHCLLFDPVKAQCYQAQPNNE